MLYIATCGAIRPASEPGMLLLLQMSGQRAGLQRQVYPSGGPGATAPAPAVELPVFLLPCSCGAVQPHGRGCRLALRPQPDLVSLQAPVHAQAAPVGRICQLHCASNYPYFGTASHLQRHYLFLDKVTLHVAAAHLDWCIWNWRLVTMDEVPHAAACLQGRINRQCFTLHFQSPQCKCLLKVRPCKEWELLHGTDSKSASPTRSITQQLHNV